MLKFKFYFVLFLFPLILRGEESSSEFVTGKLPNGFTYYIHPRLDQKKELAIRLVVKCGSVYEENEEEGVAHFLEHMVFHGSPHFKEDSIRQYLKSIGTDIGPDVNAYTTFESTVYSFDLPPRQKKKIEEAFLILSDFAGRTEFSEPLVEKEKFVILDEMRRYDANPQHNIFKKQVDLVFENNSYKDRFPIGKEKVVSEMTPSKLEHFYHKWYRPDRMALVVVGDVDPEEIKTYIENAFSSLVCPQEAALEPVLTAALQNNLSPLIHFDKNLTFTSVTLTCFSQNALDAKEAIKGKVLQSLLEQRVVKLEKQYPDFFISSWLEGYDFTNDYEGVEVGVLVFEEKIEEAVSLFNQELERVKLHGFSVSEFEKVVSQWKKTVSKLIDQENKRTVEEDAERYIDHFLEGEEWQSPSEAYLQLKEILDRLQKEDLKEKEFVEKFKQESLLTLSTPNIGIFQKIDPSLLASFFIPSEMKEKQKRWRFDDPLFSLQAFSKDKEQGWISQETEENSGEIWTLTNGVKLAIVPSPYFGSKVVIFGVGQGGTAAFSPELYPSAVLAPHYFLEREFLGLPSEEWRRFLQKQELTCQINAERNYRSLLGVASKEKLELILQVLFAFFTQELEEKNVVWEKFLTRSKSIDQLERKNPNIIFKELVQNINTGGHYLFQPIDWNRAKETETLAAFKRLFGSAQGFEWAVLGDFSIEDIKPLVSYWMGNLPIVKVVPLDIQADYPQFPKGKQEIELKVTGGLEHQTLFTFPFNYEAALEQAGSNLILEAAFTWIEMRLEESLRWNKGKTYSVDFSYRTPFYPSLKGSSIVVSFTGAKDHLHEMKEAIFREIADLKNTPLSSFEIEELKIKIENQLERQEESSRIVHEVFESLFKGTLSFYLQDRQNQLKNLKPELLQKLMQEIFKAEDYTFIYPVAE